MSERECWGKTTPSVCEAEVRRRRELTEKHALLWLKALDIALKAKPGQFVHLRVREGPLPLLRRPFSIAMAEADEVALLVQRRGLGSSLLFSARKGQRLDLLGPLGRGFSLLRRSGLGKGRRILVAGGVGIAPLLFLARRLKERGEEFSLIVGAKTEALLPLPEEICQDLKIQVATEDGSLGFKGTALDALRNLLPGGGEGVFVQACGPLGMLKALDKMRQSLRFDGEVSVEVRMGCGIGACLGCVVPVREGEAVRYLRACTEGPVFRLGEVDLSLLPPP